MRGRIALQSTACENLGENPFCFALLWEVLTRPPVASRLLSVYANITGEHHPAGRFRANRARARTIRRRARGSTRRRSPHMSAAAKRCRS